MCTADERFSFERRQTMAYSWTFYRDSLVLDQSFKVRVDKELQDNKVPTGTTLLLAARDFRIASGYTFELVGYHLTVLADRLDGAAGTIQVTGLPGHQYGGTGGSGPKVVVACRELAGIRLKCIG